MALHLRAPAKVNLLLRVVGKRDDGYHELETLFHAVDLCDDLVAERTDEPGVQLTIASGRQRGLEVATGTDNLVARAAAAYFAVSGGGSGGLRFHLHKRIPAGGGLGGGSSDAAAALRLADALSERPIGLEGLHEIAATLGADVPFFLRGGTQVGRGTGTELSAWPHPVSLSFVLIAPPFGTSTPAVYENYRPQLHLERTPTTVASIEAQFSQGISLASMLQNDLETAATIASPALGRLRSRIADAGYPGVRVSGSGSTMFIAHEDAADAAQTASSLRSIADEEGLHITETGSAPPCDPRPVPWPDNETAD